jgi:hypothetical protein
MPIASALLRYDKVDEERDDILTENKRGKRTRLSTGAAVGMAVAECHRDFDFSIDFGTIAAEFVLGKAWAR